MDAQAPSRAIASALRSDDDDIDPQASSTHTSSDPQRLSCPPFTLRSSTTVSATCAEDAAKEDIDTLHTPIQDLRASPKDFPGLFSLLSMLNRCQKTH